MSIFRTSAGVLLAAAAASAAPPDNVDATGTTPTGTRDAAASPGDASPAEGVSFFETPIAERRLLLVLDHSKSMLSKADGKTRLTRLREEVDRLFGRLDEYHYIDVHCFNDRLAVWNRRVVPCSDENLADATAFILRQRARGQTATYDALQSALVESDEQGVQRIIFVTDGEPTLGTVTHPGEILRRLKLQNREMRVPIDVLAFDTARYPARAAFMRRLASDHGGRFVPIE